MMQLQWQPAFSTSTFHAVRAVLSGWPLAEAERIEGVLRAPAESFAAEISAAELPAPLFWRHLLGLSSSLASNRELALAAVRKAIGANDPRLGLVVPRIEGHIDALERGMQELFPRLTEELTLRVGPLKEQWESRGPGLLHCLRTSLEPDVLAEQATILLVQPVLGGGGAAHLQYNSVRIEALLTNSSPVLPEPVRLAWLLAQLNCDLPRFADQVPADRLEFVAGLAMLPPVLAAAREVEWASDDAELLGQALAEWRIEFPAEMELNDVAEKVHTWWQTYQSMRPKWNVALAALDRMLGQAENSA